MKKILFLLILLPILSFSQKSKKIGYKKQAEIDSKRQIKELHKGSLLIRLSTRQKSIDALKKVGKDKLAYKLEDEQKLRNQQIVNAFRNSFDFCPVYFFYSNDSKYVIENQLDSITFLSNNLDRDPAIKIENPIYFTGEFTSLEQDTSAYQSSTYYDQGEKKTSYYGGSEISLTGLIIKNSQLYQLKHPFPYYTREFKGLFFQRAIPDVVVKMNQKLHKYYKVNQ